MRILIIEDDVVTREGLLALAGEIGADAEGVADGAAALAAVKVRVPDLVVLDYSLPDMDGVSLLRKLRSEASTRDTPVLMLTAAADLAIKLDAFELGAVDYVTKPFNMLELVARLRVAARRASVRSSEPLPTFANGFYDPVEKVLRSRAADAAAVSLTLNEDRLFRALLARGSEPVAKDDLFHAVWSDRSVGARNLDTLVSYLRKKVAPCGMAIEFVANAGYRLAQGKSPKV